MRLQALMSATTNHRHALTLTRAARRPHAPVRTAPPAACGNRCMPSCCLPRASPCARATPACRRPGRNCVVWRCRWNVVRHLACRRRRHPASAPREPGDHGPEGVAVRRAVALRGAGPPAWAAAARTGQPTPCTDPRRRGNALRVRCRGGAPVSGCASQRPPPKRIVASRSSTPSRPSHTQGQAAVAVDARCVEGAVV